MTQVSITAYMLCMAQVTELRTAHEVAVTLNTSVETIRRWARTGRLPVVKLPSGAMRFRASDIESLINPESAA